MPILEIVWAYLYVIPSPMRRGRSGEFSAYTVMNELPGETVYPMEISLVMDMSTDGNWIAGLQLPIESA